MRMRLHIRALLAATILCTFVAPIAATEFYVAPDGNDENPGTRQEPLATLAKNTITVRIAIVDPDELLFPEMVAHATFMRDGPETDKEVPE